MKFLHTSDWHLGRSLYGRKRYEEFGAFLDWLLETIEAEAIDVLLVAGDIFDTSTPSNRAQTLYYQFLCKVARTCCQQVVIIAGNHDSPSFLNAPKDLLRALNVHVIGSKCDAPEDEVIVLSVPSRQRKGEDHAIVCAVPYLRDRDVRTVEPGETIDDKNRKLVDGIQSHYREVTEIAEEKRRQLQENTAEDYVNIPILAMGHLFTAGGKTVDGDGVRELYVGSLAHVGKETFPSSIEYLALGHLHVPQVVGGSDHIRYCGSPIPMGFGEAKQQKQVLLVSLDHSGLVVQERHVPCFQKLERVVGSLDDLLMRIETLKSHENSYWLEVEYTGREVLGNLREVLEEALEGSQIEILRIKNRRVMDRVIKAVTAEETLDDLEPTDVFSRCLDTYEVPEDERAELVLSYKEIIKDLLEEDVRGD